MSAKDLQAQAEKSSNPNDWVMAGIAWIHEGRGHDMYPYCQKMANALRRRQARLTKRAADGAYCDCPDKHDPKKVVAGYCIHCEKPRR